MKMSKLVCKDETAQKGGLTMGHYNFGTYNYHTYHKEDIYKAIVALLTYKGFGIDQVIEITKRIEEIENGR